MSVNNDQCVPTLKRQNAFSLPKAVISEFQASDGDKELCSFLDRIIEEQDLREKELITIKQLRNDIIENKNKFWSQ